MFGKKNKSLIYIILAIILIPLFYLGGRFLYKKIKAPQLAYSIISADTSVLASDDNHTNFLILGTGGENHTSGDLTDTIIFTSINIKTADVVMLSIPRDIWLKSLKAKINTAYHYGNERGEGFELIKESIKEITGQPVHYSVLIDFQGFVELIDLLNGIEVDVENSFDDYKYPVPGKENADCNGDPEYQCRYQHLHFEKGLQHMDGKRALKFVRSRNAEGDEGTDFARSKRQQKVMLAIKKKILSYKTLLNPQKLLEIKKNYEKNVKIEPQLDEKEMGALVSLFRKFTKENKDLQTVNLDTGTEENPGFLINPPIEEYEQWVLVPRSGNWKNFHREIEEKIFQ